MSRLHGLGLVAGREVREALRRKTFWIVVAVLAAGSIAALVLPDVVGDDGPTTYQVGVVGGSPDLQAAIRSSVRNLDGRADIIDLADETAARTAVDDDTADVAVLADADPPNVVVKADQHVQLVGAVQQAIGVDALIGRLEAAGLSRAEAQDILQTPSARVEELHADSASRKGASFVVSLVLYVLLLTLMMQAANGTAVEKSNRISEVLLAIVRPGALLFGKVLGISIIGVLTVAAAMVPVVVKLGLGGDLPAGLGPAAASGAAWFVLGLFLFLTLAAALGSLVERPEEAGSAVMPLMAMLIGTFVVVQGGVDTTLGTVLAYLPFTSALMEPARLAQGVSSPGEIVGSLAIGLVALAFAMRIASTIYGRAIVRTGRRLKVGEVLRQRPGAAPTPG